MDDTITTEEQSRLQELELNQQRAESNTEQTLSDQQPEHSSYITTLLIFLPLAIIADLLGGLDLTGFGAIIVRIIDIPIVLTLWLWRAIKQGIGPQKKNYIFQLIGTFLLEMSPLGIFPAWSIFVLYTYFKDKKTATQFSTKKLEIKNKK